MIIQESIIVKAGRKKTFKFLKDPNNRKDIIPLLDEVILLDDGPLDVGSKYIEVSSIAGRKLKTTYMVISFEKNRNISVVTSKSIFPIRVDLNLEKKDKGTRIIIKMTLQLKGVFALSAPLVRGIVIRQAGDILMKMKKAVEEP